MRNPITCEVCSVLIGCVDCDGKKAYCPDNPDDCNYGHICPLYHYEYVKEIIPGVCNECLTKLKEQLKEKFK